MVRFMATLKKSITRLLIGAVLTSGLGCMAPNYVIDGPPGPSPDASMAICEASLRDLFTPPHPSETPRQPVIVFLKCDLDSAGRAMLIKKVKDLPVEFRPTEDEPNRASSDQQARRVSIYIRWIDDRNADVSLYLTNLASSQGGGQHLDAKYQSGQWRLYFTGRVSTIN
jgi:hypothetical protein